MLIHNGIAIFSSLLFISAGCVVWILRYNHRNSQKITTDISSCKDGLVCMNWQDSFRCGHKIIDEQHYRLFCIGNELINSFLTKKSKSDVEVIVNELVDDIENHFNTEEGVLAENNHPISEEHKEIHRSLLAKATKIRELYHIDKISIRDIVGFVCYDVVAEHIIKEDLKFIFNKNPLLTTTFISIDKGIIVESLNYCISKVQCKHNLNNVCLNNIRNCLFRTTDKPDP